MMGMLKIGSVEIGFPVVQAALSGYSDWAMRRVARLCGAEYALAEVVLDQSVLTRGKLQKRITNVEPDDHPVGGQLMGAQPEQFAQAAAMLVEAGYDVIDINFGCPVKKVLGRCRGGFLLSQPDTALDIVQSVVDAVAGCRPLTVKMRRGMDDSAKSEHKFFTILDGAFEIGIDEVTVHGRTVEQRYVGPSDWPFIKRVKQHVGDRTVMGSGDLFTADDCVRMMNETGVDGVTLARGCIGNPWIFAQCKARLAGEPLPPPPTVVEQGRVIGQHYAWAVKVHGEPYAGRLMRKFGIKYSELHPYAREVRDAFVSVHTCAEWQAALKKWYDPDTPWPATKHRTGPGDLIAAGATNK